MARTVMDHQFTEIPVLFAGSARVFVLVDAYAVFKQNCLCKVARDVMDIFPSRPLYTLKAITLNTDINLGKH